MRTLPVLCCALALLVGACEQDGELRVRNRTNSDLWVSVDESAPQHITGGSNWSKFYEADRTVSITYNGNYVFNHTLERDVRANLVSTVDVFADGGAIRLANDGSLALVELYISPSGDPNWGSHDLSGILLPGDNSIWTITQGAWDIKAVDVNNSSHFLYNQIVATNATLELQFSSFSKQIKNRKASVGSTISINPASLERS